jgi:hypothetical protein
MDTVRAKYNGSEVLVMETSSGLPDFQENPSFIDYLSHLSLSGWTSVAANFEKDELFMQLVHINEIPYPIPIYTLHTLCQTPKRRAASLSVTINELSSLASGIQEAAVRQGWQVLATSKPVLRRGGLFIVLSLWMKGNQPGGHPDSTRFLTPGSE